LPKEGFSVVTITEVAHQKAHSFYLRQVKSGQLDGKSFSRYVNDLIMDRIEADEALSRVAPFMQKVGLQDNSILLKDNKLGRMVEVQVRGKELMCLQCQKNDCVHVGFSYAIPEVYRVMSMQKGKREKF
jgi:hypothetical protein